MVPLKLTVKNFMCYRDRVPTLDLEGIHVACLCGDNGHGKSALLDSITWALWGQARTKTQDELVHQGSTDMSVELVFQARGQRYRVIRKYSRSGRSRGSTILELQLLTDETSQPVTRNSIRQTQEYIQDILHMDYDTFVNTAFLLQGRADMFTRSQPRDRKSFLAEVLDLSYYEQLESKAKDRSRHVESQIRDIDGNMSIIGHELSGRPRYETELDTVEVKLREISPNLTGIRDEINTSQTTLNVLNTMQLELEVVRRRIKDNDDERLDLERRVVESRENFERYQMLISRKAEIRQCFSQLEQVRGELARLDQASFHASDLEIEKARLDQVMAIQHQNISNRVSQLRAEIEDDLNPKVHRLPLLEQNSMELSEKQNKLSRMELDIENRRGNVLVLGSELERLGNVLEVRRDIESKCSVLERGIAISQERLKAQLKQCKERLERDLQPAADRLNVIQEEIHLSERRQDELRNSEELINQQRLELDTVMGRREFLQATKVDIEKQIAEVTSKLGMLDIDDAQCPVCGQALDIEGRQHLQGEYEEQMDELNARRDFGENEKSELDMKKLQIINSVTKLETDHQTNQKKFQERYISLSHELTEAETAFNELPSALSDIESLENDLNTGNFGNIEKIELAKLQEELIELAYDPERLTKLQDEVRSVYAEISSREEEIVKVQHAFYDEESALSTELEQARRANSEIGPRRLELEEMLITLSEEQFAKDERFRLSEIEELLSGLGYDATNHRNMKERFQELEHYSNLNKALVEAIGLEPRELKSLEAMERNIIRRKESIVVAKERLEELDNELQTLGAVEASIAQNRTVLEDLEIQEREFLAEQKSLNDRLLKLTEIEKRIGVLGSERDKLIHEKGLHDELAVAFGSNGIQALIIESSIPQLNEDANELLGKLTNHGLSLKLQLSEGRRERRTGMPSEELEIMIGDEWGGTRSYETFSGGEAFRIDFALRIALSKLLARRSGAPLPILFIDEGFGSQDSRGQERIRETIQSVQNDFDKIVVITHVEQVKDAFDTRIEVNKTPMGSTFAVI